jgi:hypothetical protein
MLKGYFDLLSLVAKGEQPYFEGDIDLKSIPLLKNLQNEELIYIDGDGFINSNNEFSITPKGALALFEWDKTINENKPLTKEKGWIFIWLAVGAALTAFGKYILG